VPREYIALQLSNIEKIPPVWIVAFKTSTRRVSSHPSTMPYEYKPWIWKSLDIPSWEHVRMMGAEGLRKEKERRQELKVSIITEVQTGWHSSDIAPPFTNLVTKRNSKLDRKSPMNNMSHLKHLSR
jgi:hypothetical protein